MKIHRRFRVVVVSGTALAQQPGLLMGRYDQTAHILAQNTPEFPLFCT
jgi:hypothetical protein